MPGLEAIAGSAEQLFLWDVLTPIIGEALKPYLQALDNRVLAENPNVPLTPAQLAGMVVRGHIPEGLAADIAKKSGIPPVDFGLMVRAYGNPPGPETLAEALRRGFIPHGQPGDENPSYAGGIAQGDLQNKWTDIIAALDARLPGPSEAIQAALRNISSGGEPERLYELFGGDPHFYRFMVDVTGEGPTPVEAGVLLNRGIIPFDNPNPNVASFMQAVRESKFKDKWAASYDAIRFYRPPPRTVSAMLHEGRLTPDEANALLLDYGVRKEDLHLYTAKAEHGAVARAHAITEAEILKLYEERGITEPEAKAALVELGYLEVDADHILAAADLSYHARLTTTWINVLKTEYLRYHISDNVVVTRLDALGVQSAFRDSLLAQWQLERRLGVKQLTAKQILDAFGVQLLNRDQAHSKLMEIGYADTDATILVLMNDPQAVPGQGTLAGLSNPGP